MVTTMRKLGYVLAALSVLALTACGGGSLSTGTSTSGGSNTSSSSGSSSSGGINATVATIKVTSSSASVPADGSVGATITAQALDVNNNAVAGATVTFSTSNNSALTNETTTTSTSGIASATVTDSGAAAGTTITVKATAGTASGSANVMVVSNQQSITLLASSPNLPSNGSKPVTIQAIVRNASNQLVTGATVAFSATSGGITPVTTTAGGAATPVVPAGTTDANGIAAASLTPAGDPTNRSITVTATVGSTQSTVTVAVNGTAMTLDGPTSLIQGGSGQYTAVLLDSGNAPIAGATVAFTSSAGNTFTPASAVTNAQGTATTSLTASKSTTPDTLTATALGQTATEQVTISTQSFNFTAPTAGSTVNLGTSQTLTLVWTNAGVPVTNTTVNFSTTRGTFNGGSGVTATATTDGTGTATVTIASTTAGPAAITASATTASNQPVTAQLALQFLATVPASVNLQANPSTIPTQSASSITAIVRDTAGNLVADQVVDFQLQDTTGGSLSAGSATTDIQGKAQVTYSSSTVQSASNGVKITATLPSTSVPPATVLLTVGGQTVFLSLGTGSVLGENAQKTQFQLPYVVQALDAGGNPVSNVSITLTVHSLPPVNPVISGVQYQPTAPNFVADSKAYAAYWKGVWVKGLTQWVWTPVSGNENGCLNEDVNGTGVFEASEDLNNNGRLDPGDVASVSPSLLATDSTGSGNLIVSYPESYGMWVQVVLTATATVSGTQTSTAATFQLPMLSTYVNNIQNAIPGEISPFGSISPSCASTQ